MLALLCLCTSLGSERTGFKYQCDNGQFSNGRRKTEKKAFAADANLGPVARNIVNTNHWLSGIEIYTFLR